MNCVSRVIGRRREVLRLIWINVVYFFGGQVSGPTLVWWVLVVLKITSTQLVLAQAISRKSHYESNQVKRRYQNRHKQTIQPSQDKMLNKCSNDVHLLVIL
jgi:hypothetical protein